MESKKEEEKAKKIEELKKIQELKLKKLESIAINYVESLLSDENEMDTDVLKYLLNDLLPLKEMHENVL